MNKEKPKCVMEMEAHGFYACWLGELERATKLQAELEHTRKQFGTCSVCGYVAWKDKDATTEECQYCKLKAELERVQKQAAEMKRLLERFAEAYNGDEAQDYQDGKWLHDQIKHALDRNRN